MASQAIESQRENAEIHYGDEVCKQKIQETLKEFELPTGLLPLQDIIEVGRNHATGFVWLKQKKSIIHHFRHIGKEVSYAEEVTAFMEKQRFKKIVGVKSKELLLWVTIGEIYVDEKNPEKIWFKNPLTGVTLSFPVSALQLEEVMKGEGEGEEKKGEGVESK